MQIIRIIDNEQAKSYCEDIVGTIEYLQDERKRLYEENQQLKNEHYKDAELKRLADEISGLQEEMNILRKCNQFTLTTEEIEAIDAWQKKHNTEKHPDGYFGAIGGELTYKFIPTSIGMIGTVRCICGAEYKFRNME